LLHGKKRGCTLVDADAGEKKGGKDLGKGTFILERGKKGKKRVAHPVTMAPGKKEKGTKGKDKIISSEFIVEKRRRRKKGVWLPRQKEGRKRRKGLAAAVVSM